MTNRIIIIPQSPHHAQRYNRNKTLIHDIICIIRGFSSQHKEFPSFNNNEINMVRNILKRAYNYIINLEVVDNFKNPNSDVSLYDTLESTMDNSMLGSIINIQILFTSPPTPMLTTSLQHLMIDDPSMTST